MNFNNFTIKAQEAIQKASEIAQGNQQQAIETAHILKGLLTVDENVVSYVLKKLNVNLNTVEQNLSSAIEKLPKVSGGNAYLSSSANSALQKAQSYLKEFKDDFVSVEHLLLGIFISAAADLLFKNSLEEFAQALWKVNSYVLFPLLFAGISYLFATLFYPNLKVSKELFKKTIIFLALISIADELLTMFVICTKYKNFIVYDLYTYPLIVVVSLFQIGVGCIMGLYFFNRKHDNFSV